MLYQGSSAELVSALNLEPFDSMIDVIPRELNAPMDRTLYIKTHYMNARNTQKL